MAKRKTGKIIPNGVVLEKHEYDTITFLTSLGHNIELIPPSSVPNMRTPDFYMNGESWEMKSPKGNSRSTLEHTFKSAAKQSVNIIIDLRRTNLPEEKSGIILSQLMKSSKIVKKLGIITKKRELLWFPFD